MGEAVKLVEQAGKGRVVKAEMVGEGSASQFNVEVVADNGGRGTYQLSANGRVLVENFIPPKGKGTKKKNN